MRPDVLPNVALLLLLIAVVLLAIWVYLLRRQVRSDSPEVRTFEPSTLISPEQAKAGAQTGFESYGLLTRADWRPYLFQKAMWQPLLVQRLDTADVYYLVPIGPSDDAVTAIALVDGFSGEYLEASAAVPPGSTWAWRGVETLTPDGRQAVAHASFVWKPCVESRSPFFPFRLMTINDRARYVRIDGEEFDGLTELSALGIAEYSRKTRDDRAH